MNRFFLKVPNWTQNSIFSGQRTRHIVLVFVSICPWVRTCFKKSGCPPCDSLEYICVFFDDVGRVLFVLWHVFACSSARAAHSHAIFRLKPMDEFHLHLPPTICLVLSSQPPPPYASPAPTPHEDTIAPACTAWCRPRTTKCSQHKVKTQQATNH